MTEENENNNHDGDGYEVSPLDNTVEVATAAVDVEHKAAALKLKTLQRDGIIRNDVAAQMGVLQRLMQAATDAEYRQELKKSNLSEEDQDEFVAAISEAKRYGCTLTPIVDLLVARNGGIKGWLIGKILEGLTHTTFTTNFKGKSKDGKSGHSLLS